MTSDRDAIARLDTYEPSPFERVVQRRERPQFSIEPVAVAWDAVAFRLSGERDGVACVPRAELNDFLDKLEAGALDEPIVRFLASPPSGRILRAASQTGRTGLFDEMGSPDAIVPPERVPGRPRPFGIGGRGGSPADARDRKGHRRGRGSRRLLVGLGVAVLVIGAGVAVASRGGGKATVAAVATTTVPPTTAPTTTTRPRDAVIAESLTGVWTVTRTVTASTNPPQPVGDISEVSYTITSSCTVSPCTLHLNAPGSLGASEQSELTFSGDHYEGALTGSSPCADSSGTVFSVSPITGTVSFTPTGTAQLRAFTGILDLVIGASPSCDTDRAVTFTLAGEEA